ncbi:MAG TPA: HemK/PrmC family methyltransferase [Acidimicrobiales bacterium]|nr:HemK/PrmC family methyltransferase [Acidimicrobiales bacterium]
MARARTHGEVIEALRRAGCVAADDEARELVDSAGTAAALDAMVARRVAGEPLAWITGRTVFCGLELHVDPGVFVPRWQSEGLARTASVLLPEHGVAVDLCTGAGSIAAVLAAGRPAAEVRATELDPVAVACARRNGVRVAEGDLFAPLPPRVRGLVDVLTAVAPYVPHSALHRLPRDVTDFEPAVALDGGDDGLDVVRRIVAESVDWVRAGGDVLLEVGSDQCDDVTRLFEGAGYHTPTVIEDADGDPRGVCARRG